MKLRHLNCHQRAKLLHDAVQTLHEIAIVNTTSPEICDLYNSWYARHIQATTIPEEPADAGHGEVPQNAG